MDKEMKKIIALLYDIKKRLRKIEGQVTEENKINKPAKPVEA